MKYNMREWRRSLVSGDTRLTMPILSFPSTQLLGVTVRELIGSSDLQARGMKAIADRVPSCAAVSMMDLSVEAECFGATIHVSDDEIPTISDPVVTDADDADALLIPEVGSCRTGRYIEAIGHAKQLITDRPVLAGVIGPFSLAGRLMSVSDIMVNCLIEPETVHTLMRKTTDFIKAYIGAYKSIGADGIVMAEPMTGLLSPALAEEFSEPYVREIISELQDDDFLIVYHNCGDNTVLMIDSILRVGAAAYHFGNAIDMAEMLRHIPADIPVMGNVDPAGQFCNGTPESVRRETLRIMDECCPDHPNFVISSGCDIPPMSSWANIDAYFAAVAEYADTHPTKHT